MAERLTDFPVFHAGIKPVFHSRLGTQINGQTAIRYMRFGQPVKIDRLQLARIVYGRWMPSVPTHPAHLLISTLDRNTHRWKLIRKVDLPPDSLTAGEGLN